VDIFSKVTGFDWDDGNKDKNLITHSVSCEESEQAFFNIPIIVAEDSEHSINEKRYHLYGQTDSGRKLHIVFTIRALKIRVISARDMSKKERVVYDEEIKKDS